MRGTELKPGRGTAGIFLASLCYVTVFFFPVEVRAQEAEKPTAGINSGNYNIRQSFEFGYRVIDVRGSAPVYRTFVRLSQGPRLFEHTLQMRSLNHRGVLFDDFSLSSFGYGGDANAVTRLRAYKNQWYNFGAAFRLDRDRWDYNLLANPLNPPNSNPFVPITSSPHRVELVRRLSDYYLTLFPQSRLRLRFGYSRNINEGPSFNTFHEGTEVLVFQDWKTTLNSYSFGVDLKVLPKTNISYDQYLHYYKGDTTWTDTVGTTQLGVPRFFAQLSDGTPLDLGVVFNTPAGQPCSAPIANPSTTPPTASATCNGYLAYNRVGNARTSYPTEQLSFQSSYFRDLDLSGRVSYSSSENGLLGYGEFFQGLVTRTRQRQFQMSGPARAKRVSVTADLGVTWQVSARFQVINSFHFTHFRIPGFFALAESSLFGTSMLTAPNTFTPGPTPPSNCPTITSPGCPQHNTNSPADVISERFSLFSGQNSKHNDFKLLYDFSRRFSGRLGYRYANRKITEGHVETADLLFFPTLPNRGACAGQPLLPDGSCRAMTTQEDLRQTKINEHSLLLGLSARPMEGLRLSFDLELMSADRAFTRISPRQMQRYKIRGSYEPVYWAHLGLSINILEKRNNVVEIFHKQHNRSYGFSAQLEPNDKFGFEMGYDLNDIFSQINICFTGSLRPPGTSPCPTSLALLQQISVYDNTAHFGHFGLTWRPLRRVTTNLGYAVTSAEGSTLILNPNAPPGPLRFEYHKPYAGLAVDLVKGLTWKVSWGYYGYNESGAADPTGSRDFRGNLVTVALRHGF